MDDQETATQRMARAFAENGLKHTGLIRAAIEGKSDILIANNVARSLKDEFSVADIRKAIDVSVQDHSETLMRRIVEERDAILNEIIADGGALLGRLLQDGSEIFSLDGVDVVQFWPPMVHTEIADGQPIFKADQEYRRLS